MCRASCAWPRIPVRWGLLSALARSDLRVNELTGMVGQSQNLVSYHLGQLRTGQLVSTRRSAADGRDTYYSLDLSRCGDSWPRPAVRCIRHCG